MKRRRRRRAGVLIAALAAAAVALWQPPWAYDGLARAMPGIVWSVEGAGPRIALTFDDGPSPEHTPEVLAILQRHRARATFFLIGAHAAAHPELVARIRAEGHEVANHYSRKGTTVFEDEAAFLAEVRRTEAAIGPLAPHRLFRPPGGFIRPAHREALDRMGYRTVLGSAYPYDGNGPPAAYIRWLAVKNLRPGAIVILHDGVADPANTLAALDPILEAARSKGLAVVPVGELLAAPEAVPTVVFVCEHGTVKSVIAAEVFNRRAAERTLPFRAVSRGIAPDPEVPAGVAQNLRKDGYDVSGFRARALDADDVKAATHVVAIGVETPLLKDARAASRWTDIPPASTQYAAARDAMAKRIDALLDALARDAAPPRGR